MFPLSGRPAVRLCQFAGIPPQEEGSRYGRYYWALRERFDTVNLLDTPTWKVPEARAAAEALDLSPVNVLLGRRVAQAVLPYSADRLEWGRWHQLGEDRWAAVIPHPSGRNYLYNAPQIRDLAGVTLREALRRAEDAGRALAS